VRPMSNSRPTICAKSSAPGRGRTLSSAWVGARYQLVRWSFCHSRSARTLAMTSSVASIERRAVASFKCDVGDGHGRFDSAHPRAGGEPRAPRYPAWLRASGRHCGTGISEHPCERSPLSISSPLDLHHDLVVLLHQESHGIILDHPYAPRLSLSSYFQPLPRASAGC
jgi:hypothetical protein